MCYAQHAELTRLWSSRPPKNRTIVEAENHLTLVPDGNCSEGLGTLPHLLIDISGTTCSRRARTGLNSDLAKPPADATVFGEAIRARQKLQTIIFYRKCCSSETRCGKQKSSQRAKRYFLANGALRTRLRFIRPPFDGAANRRLLVSRRHTGGRDRTHGLDKLSGPPARGRVVRPSSSRPRYLSLRSAL